LFFLHFVCFLTKLTAVRTRFNRNTKSNLKINELALVKHKNTQKNLILKQFICNNCSYQCVYDCAQLCYTIQHRTFLIISPHILNVDNHHSSDHSDVVFCIMEERRLLLTKVSIHFLSRIFYRPTRTAGAAERRRSTVSDSNAC